MSTRRWMLGLALGLSGLCGLCLTTGTAAGEDAGEEEPAGGFIERAIRPLPDQSPLEVPPLPAGVARLSEERQARLDALVSIAESLRGLEAGPRVPGGQQDTEAFTAFLERSLAAVMPGERLARAERVLEWFGVMPEELDLEGFIVELMSSQVGGYFDLESGHLVMVDPVADPSREPDASREVFDSAVLLHEVVHYLQDLHFDLMAPAAVEPGGVQPGGVEPGSDQATALDALHEGDATLSMYSYMFGFDFERAGALSGLFQSLLADPAAVMEAAPDLPGAEELATAPLYFRETLLFPYLQGLLFNLELRVRGGTKLADYAFAEDPPRSTEQILHPEKWLDQRDEPVAFTRPDASPLEELFSSNWGELGARIVLAERSGLGIAEEVATAAAGWGGDRYVLYAGPGDAEILLWATEWDSAEDADEFAALAAGAFAGWTLERRDQRVVLADGVGPGAAELATVAVERWLVAEATRPERRAPDLAAIGIGPEDVPEPMGAADFAKLAANPAFLEGADVENMAALLENPAAQEAISSLMKDLSPEEIEELMNSPEVQAIHQRQLAAMPALEVEGARVAVPALGVTLAAPSAAGWSHSEPGDGSHVFVHGEGASLGVNLFPLPAGYPLDGIAAVLETQLAASELVRLEDGYRTAHGVPSYFARFGAEEFPGAVEIQLLHIENYCLILTVGRPAGLSEPVIEELERGVGSLELAGAAPEAPSSGSD